MLVSQVGRGPELWLLSQLRSFFVPWTVESPRFGGGLYCSILPKAPPPRVRLSSTNRQSETGATEEPPPSTYGRGLLRYLVTVG